MKTLIIGDIHGCYTELQTLIDKFGPVDGDRIFCVGDIINRGPDSSKCLDLLRKLNVRSVMGNHEHWYLKAHPFKDHSVTSYNFRKLEIEDHYDWIKSLPYYIISDNFIIVHAGFDPSVAFKDNSKESLVSVRTLPHTNLPWFDGYYGTKHIYFGHWAKLGVFFGKNVTNLDGGCVYGGHLCGYVIEDNRLIKIPAKRTYHNIHEEII